MSMSGDGKFKIGERVISFRGELATVTDYQERDDPSKSDYVWVQFDYGAKGQFYARVFRRLEK